MRAPHETISHIHGLPVLNRSIHYQFLGVLLLFSGLWRKGMECAIVVVLLHTHHLRILYKLSAVCDDEIER
jgi:hypothetical protein